MKCYLFHVFAAVLWVFFLGGWGGGELCVSTSISEASQHPCFSAESLSSEEEPRWLPPSHVLWSHLSRLLVMSLIKRGVFPCGDGVWKECSLPPLLRCGGNHLLRFFPLGSTVASHAFLEGHSLVSPFSFVCTPLTNGLVFWKPSSSPSHPTGTLSVLTLVLSQPL